MIPNWALTPNFYKEWLATNGSGAFASGSVAGAVTRRYHAFLCAAIDGPQDRRVTVTKIEETVRCGGASTELSANFWPHEISPRGDQFIGEFALDPNPRWIYRVPHQDGEIVIEKTIWMVPDENTTVARYELQSGPACELQVRAFVAPRSYHGQQRANADFNGQLDISADQQSVSLRPYDSQPPVHLAGGGRFCADENWYYNFHWPIEAERGLDSLEDAFCPGYFCLSLRTGEPQFVVASTDEIDVARAASSRATVVAAKRELIGGDDAATAGARLRLGADQFIVKRADGLHTVLAGYPWFTDWGRDTMIALPGLCLTTKRFDIAASILRSFAGAMSQGMIPNRFPEGNETPDYNTVDGTLWFFHAVFQYGHISGDWKTVRELYPKLVESIEWHLAGTRFGIVADDDDGMLRAGDHNSQLTWMDAKIGEVAFTPRAGQTGRNSGAVVQRFVRNGELGTPVSRIIIPPRFAPNGAAKSPVISPKRFGTPAENCLYDCIGDNGKDGAIRPNQIFAVSLPHHLLSADKQKSVVEVVQRELLTPVGLRSLSPRDSRYRGVYRGDAWQRDSAYHQGTVWGWLLGPFFGSVFNRSRAGRRSG